MSKRDYYIHVNGPDDVLGPFTRLKALDAANMVNSLYVKECEEHTPENTPMCVAVVKHKSEMQ